MESLSQTQWGICCRAAGPSNQDLQGRTEEFSVSREALGLPPEGSLQRLSAVTVFSSSHLPHPRSHEAHSLYALPQEYAFAILENVSSESMAGLSKSEHGKM